MPKFGEARIDVQVREHRIPIFFSLP